jgi:hypothetical protein
MVLVVHGGPWGRDGWGLSSTHQWLANRGYAVLSVNFRGSTGLGKAFVNAANLEWGAKMHDDLIDAVDWAIAQKIADPQRVAIYGASYGWVRRARGRDVHPGEVRVRRRHLRDLEPLDDDRNGAAVLEAGADHLESPNG